MNNVQLRLKVRTYCSTVSAAPSAATVGSLFTAHSSLAVVPKSDEYPSFSPYTYCANNPAKLVDPDGMKWETENDKAIATEISNTAKEKMRHVSYIIIFIAVTFELNCQNFQINNDCYQNVTTKIIFNSDSSFVLLNKGIDMLPISGYGDDTLSYGIYSKNSKYYILNSDSLINSDFLQLSVSELYSMDSLVTIIFDSPYSRYKKSNIFLDSSYYYLLSVTFTDSLGHNIFKQDYSCFNDTFEIINSNNHCILEFNLKIYPYKYLSLREKPYYPFLRSYYKVNNTCANQLHVEIPFFTPMYIYYERYSNELLYILDSNTIGARQCYLLSKGKYRRKHRIRKFLSDTGCMSRKEARCCF